MKAGLPAAGGKPIAMNWALWKKAVSDLWLLLAVSAALLVLFGWVFVWFTSLFQLGAWGTLLSVMPSALKPMFGVPIAQLASPAGQISVVFVHPITLLVSMGWAVGRGSDAVSGEIGRGTMEHLLALPVRRAWLIVVPAVCSTLGAAVLATALWLGVWLGIATVELHASLGVRQFLPGAVNLFALTFCMTGLTAFCSSWDHNRWRTMALAVGLYVVSFLVWLVVRVWPAGWWLKYLTFLTAFEPQQLILMPTVQSVAWRYHGTLLAIGLLSYATAAVILTFRDIPQPR